MTISEIAAKAGVSAATVSRVLNGKGHVKDSTRQQILHVIRQNEYVPSEIARGLSKSDSNNIGVFVTDIENPFFSKAVRGIAEKADLYGYNVFLFNTDEDPEKEHRYLQTVLGLRIKGLIISPVFETDDETRLRLQRMQERGVPVVLLDRDIRGLPLDGVFSEDEEGAYQAVRSLILAGEIQFDGLLAVRLMHPQLGRLGFDGVEVYFFVIGRLQAVIFLLQGRDLVLQLADFVRRFI